MVCETLSHPNRPRSHPCRSRGARHRPGRLQQRGVARIVRRQRAARLPRAVPEVGRGVQGAVAAARRRRLGRVAPRPRSRRLRAAYARRARADAVPGRLQQGREARGLGRRSGVRRHLGHLPQGLRPSAVPHGRCRRRDRGGRGEARQRRGQRAALAARAVALQRAPLVPQDGAPARGALRHELRLWPAAAVRAGVVEGPGGQLRALRRDAAASTLATALAATPRACSRPMRSRSPRRPPTTSPTTSPTSDSSRCWPGSRSATHRRHDHPHGPREATWRHPQESNHWYGRAATISEVDGEAVRPGSHAAAASGTSCRRRPRRYGPTRSALPGRTRPTRAGSPAPTRRGRSTSASTPSAPRPRLSRRCGACTNGVPPSLDPFVQAPVALPRARHEAVTSP